MTINLEQSLKVKNRQAICFLLYDYEKRLNKI